MGITMKLLLALPVLAALAFPMLSNAANETTIDFEATGTLDAWNALDYDINGYVFNTTMDNLDATYFGLPESGHSGTFAALNNQGGIGEMSRKDGAAFSLIHLSVANWPWALAGGTFTASGYLKGSLVATASITADFGWQTLYAQFAKVDKVSFQLKDNKSIDTFVIDDIVVASAVPEPETYAMLLAGLGLAGFAARRRKEAKRKA
jgi:hypothetical protein